MSRKAQSPWDFGELFPTEQIRHVLTVAELTANVRRLLEKEIGEVWVSGEVTNFKIQNSGHLYFSLKDGTSQINCVLFRNEPVGNREFLQDVQKLIVQGGLTVYEPRGVYQLIVRAIEPRGVGALQIAFEKLKRQLQAEGLFAQERKRPLPRYPHRIGVVTSPTGAAIRDVLHVIKRRQPWLEIVLAPCRVQGDGAAAEVAAAIRLLNRWNQTAGSPRLDLVLVTRGGGSLEDLWAFNEEVVARAIFQSELPVVSAVWHEIDFTISDFVADVRAATPSAGAEIITEGPFASRQLTAEIMRRLRQLIRSRTEFALDEVHEYGRRLQRMHPQRLLQEKAQYVDDLHERLVRCARQGMRGERNHWTQLMQRLLRLKPSFVLLQRRQNVREKARQLAERAGRRLELARRHVQHLSSQLQLLGPQNVLARGYSITTDATTGKVLRSIADVRSGRRLKSRLADGEVQSVVEGER
jgi:exodeoxyribonuclease VII large subunit